MFNLKGFRALFHVVSLVHKLMEDIGEFDTSCPTAGTHGQRLTNENFGTRLARTKSLRFRTNFLSPTARKARSLNLIMGH
jgi:hypothetical protein